MDKLWKGRFHRSADTRMEEFTASIFFDQTLAREDLLGSIAHATTLGKGGVLTQQEGETIKQGLIAIYHDLDQALASFTVSDEDIHMNIERLLKEKIGTVAGKLHTGRSRNDQVALDMHLYLRGNLLSICDHLITLIQTLLHKAKEHLHVIFPGYTHLQRAQPIYFSHHLLAYTSMLLRDLARLQDSWPRVNQLPLGAAALAGTKVPIDSQHTAKLLAFDNLYENSLDAVSDRDFVVEFLFTGSLVMIHLSRLSEELVLWASQEFHFIEFDDAFCTGSSLMPQKKNPDIPELIRAKSGRVCGNLVTLLMVLKGLPLAYNKDLQEDKEPLFDTMNTLSSSLSILSPLIQHMRLNTEAMSQATHQGFLNATDLADYLVAKGMPFREAHSLIGKIISDAMKKEMTLEGLTLEEYQAYSPLFEKDLYPAIAIQNVVESKKSYGGTSSASVATQLQKAEEAVQKASQWVGEKKQQIHAAEENLIQI